MQAATSNLQRAITLLHQLIIQQEPRLEVPYCLFATLQNGVDIVSVCSVH